MPEEHSLANLLHTAELRQLVGPALWSALNAVRKLGNAAAHGETAVTQEQAGKAAAIVRHFLQVVAKRYDKAAPTPIPLPAGKSPRQKGVQQCAACQRQNEAMQITLQPYEDCQK